ncbi:hypothetical protein C5955_13245 [Cronobacter sakazakii]|nr:hypothetical protein C5955_13245 [Cronobacter sakazakii]
MTYFIENSYETSRILSALLIYCLSIFCCMGNKSRHKPFISSPQDQKFCIKRIKHKRWMLQIIKTIILRVAA